MCSLAGLLVLKEPVTGIELSDFSYTKDIRVDALSDSPLIEGEEQDRLSSLSLFNIATRTWPYIRPEIKHLSALTLTFLLLILLGIVTIGLLTDIFYNHLINGDPLSDRLLFVLNLEGREYLDVEKLSDEARQEVRAGMFRFASIVAVLGEDHELVFKLNSIIVDHSAKTADDFEFKKWFQD